MKALVFVDVTDPWSYIGATRLERAAATFTIIRGEPVQLLFRSAQLEPDEASEGRPLMEALAERLGGADKAELLNVQVTRAARISGIDLNFADAIQANSFDAHRLLAWAGEVATQDGDPGVQRDLVHQLWRAHLLEGADIADHFALATRAALVGLDLESAEALLASNEYADVVRLQTSTAFDIGVTQLPTIVIGERWTLAGMHSQDDYVQALDRIWADAQADGV